MEFVLVIPLVFLLIAGIMEVAVVARTSLQLAAAPVTFRPFGAAGSATAEAAWLVRATAAAEFRPVALLDGPELRPVAGRGTKVHPVPRPSR